jgi:glycosyltransferase involved in cell wall biosynthesis
MAAGIPVVSTTVGAEGLDVIHGENIRLADTPESFAAECLDLLEDAAAARRISDAALRLVTSRFSWEKIAGSFEEILVRVTEQGQMTALGR